MNSAYDGVTYTVSKEMEANRQDISVVVTVVAFRYYEKKLQVQLEEDRALPQSLLQSDESLESAAFRAVQSCGFKINYLEQLYTFGLPDRKPSSRELSVTYLALVRPGQQMDESRWQDVYELPSLAIDFDKMIRLSVSALRMKFKHEPLVFELLPSQFPFSEVEHIYSAVMGIDVDRRNFKKKFLANSILVELDEKLKRKVGRPAALFRFNARKFFELQKEGGILNLI